MSSKRSTQTTNTFVSGPRGGKDLPLDDLFVFANGLNCIKFDQTLKQDTKLFVNIQDPIQLSPFWQIPGFQNGWERAQVSDCVV